MDDETHNGTCCPPCKTKIHELYDTVVRHIDDDASDLKHIKGRLFEMTWTQRAIFTAVLIGAAKMLLFA